MLLILLLRNKNKNDINRHENKLEFFVFVDCIVSLDC